MASSASSRPHSHRVRMEDVFVRRREKQHTYETTWANRHRYYQHWEKNNHKFEAWTSPRYYAANNELIDQKRNERRRAEALEKRQTKLAALLHDEQELLNVEIMMKRTNELSLRRRDQPSSGVDALRTLNSAFKVDEMERQRHEAELKLYQQWRNNNPILRLHERTVRNKELKLAWLDQQIEKRMQREREEEEQRLAVAQMEAMVQQQRAEAQRKIEEAQRRREQLKTELEQQMEMVREQEVNLQKLKERERQEALAERVLADCVAQLERERERRAAREHQLFNVRQHRLKLRQKAIHVLSDLDAELMLLERLMRYCEEQQELEEEERRKARDMLVQIQDLNRQHKALEVRRQEQCMALLFDSESEYMYDRRCEEWRTEEQRRNRLLQEVLTHLRKQVEEKAKQRQQEQRERLDEKERTLQLMEELQQQMTDLREKEARVQCERKRELDAQVALKQARKAHEVSEQRKMVQEDLERMRKEEERLRNEIAQLQRKMRPQQQQPQRQYRTQSARPLGPNS